MNPIRRPKTPAAAETKGTKLEANSTAAAGESTGYAVTPLASHVPSRESVLSVHDFRWLDEAERKAATGNTSRADRRDTRWSE